MRQQNPARGRASSCRAGRNRRGLRVLAAAAPTAAAGRGCEAVVAAPPVRVKDHVEFGASAFASRAFAAGDVVLCEPSPLITSPPPPFAFVGTAYRVTAAALSSSSGERGGQQQQQHGALLANGTEVGVEDLLKLTGQFLAWCMAPTAVRQHILTRMHASPGPDLRDSDLVLLSEWAAAIIAERLLPYLPSLLPRDTAPLGSVDAQLVERVLLAFAMNSHELGGGRCVRPHERG